MCRFVRPGMCGVLVLELEVRVDVGGVEGEAERVRQRRSQVDSS